MTNDDSLLWDIVSTRTIGSYPIFDLYCSQRSARHGTKCGNFYILKMPVWVTVIPVITDSSGEDSFILVKQFRHGINKILAEFPAGLKDESETPYDAAKRELLEETGYTAGTIELLETNFPCPSFIDNKSYTFIGLDLVNTGSPSFDALELIESYTITAREMGERIENRDEKFMNGQTIISYYSYLKWKKGKV
jgi:ADP-ribose pyrophosphatase